MKITNENLASVIDTLRKCARQHANDEHYTGAIVTTDLCNDVADFLTECILGKTELDSLTWTEIRYIVKTADDVLNNADRKDLLEWGEKGYYERVLAEICLSRNTCASSQDSVLPL